jgi:uncharacterized protein (DUF885 family)
VRRPAALALCIAGIAGMAAAAVPPDLAESARQLELFPATRGEGSESERLRTFFDLFWITELREGPEFATYVGVPGLDDRLSDLAPETLDLARRISREERTALASIDRAKLTPAEQVNYDLASERIEQGIQGERFHGEYLLIHQMTGIQQDLPRLLASMPARTLQDYENLLADDPLKSPVLESFQSFPETVPTAERERLRREAAQVFKEQVTPALTKLRDYLVKVYIPGARESIAMSAMPDGEAWYAFRLRNATTTDLTPAQIHQLGLSEVARIRKEMDELIASTGFTGGFEAFCNFLRTDPRFYYDRPEDLVAGFRDIAKRIDPELIRLFGRLPRLPYGVTPMAESAAKSSPTAYYTNGSLAAGRPGWFEVNTYDLKSRPKWGMEALTLHEAVPGHHLQYALVEELEDLPEWRKWDVYSAFTEGWGLYAESLGSEVGLYKDPYSRFGRLTLEIWRALRLVVDTGLHTMGWTRQQAIDYMKANSARADHEVEVEVDRYIVSPAGATVYKIGELKIQELRAYATKELGPRFDLRAFHDHVLGSGQLPLRLLEKNIKAWVAEEKAQNPSPERGKP